MQKITEKQVKRYLNPRRQERIENFLSKSKLRDSYYIRLAGGYVPTDINHLAKLLATSRVRVLKGHLVLESPLDPYFFGAVRDRNRVTSIVPTFTAVAPLLSFLVPYWGFKDAEFRKKALDLVNQHIEKALAPVS